MDLSHPSLLCQAIKQGAGSQAEQWGLKLLRKWDQVVGLAHHTMALARRGVVLMNLGT